MPVGRTLLKYVRAYVAGYDLSGDTRTIGPLSCGCVPVDLTTITDAVKGYLPGQGTGGPGTLNAVLDPTAATGIQAVLNGAGVLRVVMFPIGIQAAPTFGNPAYMGQFNQADFTVTDASGAAVVNVPFSAGSDVTAAMNYFNYWGVLLHPNQSETAANASATNSFDGVAPTTKGGYLVYQAFASNGTATLSIDDSADNAAFAPLAGATSGSINPSATPVAGLVQLGTAATVRRYLRWQLALGTATTFTWAIAFVRG